MQFNCFTAYYIFVFCFTYFRSKSTEMSKSNCSCRRRMKWKPWEEDVWFAKVINIEYIVWKTYYVCFVATPSNMSIRVGRPKRKKRESVDMCIMMLHWSEQQFWFTNWMNCSQFMCSCSHVQLLLLFFQFQTVVINKWKRLRCLYQTRRFYW